MKTTKNERVRELRNSLKMNQTQLAIGCGVSLATISKVEIGEMPVSDKLIKALSSSYNVNENWIETGKGEMFLEGGAKTSISPASVNVWEQALIKELKEEVTYLRTALMSALSGGKNAKANFLKALDVARVHRLNLSGTYSGANAA